jgi:uncharacterized SAM-binding protein YcdF (DUF218 family)
MDRNPIQEDQQQTANVEASPAVNPTPENKRLRGFVWFLGGSFAAVVILVTVAFLGVGKWLVVDQPLRQATAIAVLSGNIPSRAMEAAELYHDGYAKEIWLTHPSDKTVDGLKDLGLHYPSEEELNVQVLKRQGVPAKAIHVLDAPVANTADELEAIGSTLKSKGGDYVIVVTNKAHTRRVNTLWNKYDANSGHAIIHAVVDDDFQPSHWWSTTGDTTQVLHEVMGLLNAYAGLPVQGNNRAHDSISAGEVKPPDLMPDAEKPGKKQQPQ